MASTRLPDKPLADIGGLPMVVRVARQAARSGARRVVVAADDARVMAACLEHGVEAVLTRIDHASGSDRLAEACALLGLDGTDIVVNVQGDEPLIDPALIRQCADLLETDGEAVVVHVRNIRSGEMDLYRGTSHVRVHDRARAAKLARASK